MLHHDHGMPFAVLKLVILKLQEENKMLQEENKMLQEENKMLQEKLFKKELQEEN